MCVIEFVGESYKLYNFCVWFVYLVNYVYVFSDLLAKMGWCQNWILNLGEHEKVELALIFRLLVLWLWIINNLMDYICYKYVFMLCAFAYTWICEKLFVVWCTINLKLKLLSCWFSYKLNVCTWLFGWWCH